MPLFKQNNEAGILLRHRALVSARPTLWNPQQDFLAPDALRWAFVVLYIFTFLLYARPNDWVPGLASFPLVKLITLIAPVSYLAAKIVRGEALTIWPIELKMLLVILALSLLFIPVAQSKEDALNVLTDTFIKLVIIFTLLINVITTRARLQALLKLIVVCGTVLAVGAIYSYLRGDFVKGRIEGVVGGIFGNANDLATAINILLGITITRIFMSKGIIVRCVYGAVALLMATAVLATFSRAGFLGLALMLGVLVWKLRRRHRRLPIVAVLVLAGALSFALSGKYGAHMATILNPSEDKTESAQLRSGVLVNAVNVAVRHPLIGVGMGNFYLYSRHDLKAHNSYIEIAAELGWIGLIAYLILLFAPLRALMRIERATVAGQDAIEKEDYYTSIGLQAAIVSYLLCSAFSSIQYSWFVYYPIAFAIALRNIHAPEIVRARVKTRTLFRADSQHGDSSPQPGLLWPQGDAATTRAALYPVPINLKKRTKALSK